LKIPVSESTGEEAGYSNTTGISMNKFLVFVMKVMVFFVPVLNKVLNSDPFGKTRYELTLQYIINNAFKMSDAEAVKRTGTVWAVL
jgi:hypothetical protein